MNQFGHLSKQEREWTQAGARFGGGEEGGYLKQLEWANEKRGEIRWQLMPINN